MNDKQVEERKFLPGRVPIDAYGNGGFRFSEMSHRGSLLLLPSGAYAWPVNSFVDISTDSFADIIHEADEIEFVLLGSGETLQHPDPELRDFLREHNIGLEVMDTGAAARTYNVLLGEKRQVAAALIAVDNPTRS